ncbi:hypothetical protein [Nonomuraea rubra]|uniref:hypothetical protein n=1 Tax=Nonomuraea rubra TaxID=46180 RepID=UPI0033FF0F6B
MIPFERELSRCKWPHGGCGRRILWVITARGNRQALDPKPVGDGPVAAYRIDGRKWAGRSLQGAEAAPLGPHEDRFNPHVMTCPKSGGAAAAAPTEIPGLLPGAEVISLDAARRRRRGRGRQAG